MRVCRIPTTMNAPGDARAKAAVTSKKTGTT
jgi:hypothetical protein